MIKSEKGVTLIEVVSALALLSTVLFLAGSVHFFSQKQMTVQSAEVRTQSNVRLAAKLLTKDIRRAVNVEEDPVSKPIDADAEDRYFIITSPPKSPGEVEFEDKYKYIYKDNILYKNGQELITKLESFEILITVASVTVTIADLPTTTIYIRK